MRDSLFGHALIHLMYNVIIYTYRGRLEKHEMTVCVLEQVQCCFSLQPASFEWNFCNVFAYKKLCPFPVVGLKHKRFDKVFLGQNKRNGMCT